MKRLAIIMFLGSTFAAGGCKAGPASGMETSIMTAVKHSIAIRNRNEKNPLAVTSANIAAGQKAFNHYCVACHGKDGQNTGVPFAKRMSPPVPSLASTNVQSYTDGQLKSVIDDGIAPSGMPGSKGILSDEEIWGMVVFIRHLPPAGSLGDPEMYSK